MRDPVLLLSQANELEFKDNISPKSPIKSIVSNLHSTAILTKDGDVFTVDHNPSKNSKFEKAVKKNVSSIVKITAGANHFLALKKVYRPPFREWSSEMLQQWMQEVGFEEFVNVIKNSRISAEMMEKADHKFIMDNFGLLNDDSN